MRSQGGWAGNLTSNRRAKRDQLRPLLGRERHAYHPALLADGPGAPLDVLRRLSEMPSGAHLEPPNLLEVVAALNRRTLGNTIALDEVEA